METAKPKSTAKKSTTTTTKKKTTTSTTTRKPRTPKPPVEVTTEVVETPKPPKPERKIEREEKIRVFIPLDPYIAEREGQVMIGSDNGRFFKYQRGKEHLLEKGHAEYILFRLEGERQAEAFIEANRWKEKN